ncbi:hypothetical protein ACLKA7_011836 [Drosophila subpalustris]
MLKKLWDDSERAELRPAGESRIADNERSILGEVICEKRDHLVISNPGQIAGTDHSTDKAFVLLSSRRTLTHPLNFLTLKQHIMRLKERDSRKL